VSVVKQQAGIESHEYAVLLVQLGVNLLQQNKPTEAEKLLRECLAIREKKEPDAIRTFNAKSVLGATLLGQKRYAEAESLLVQGYEGMRQREPPEAPPEFKVRLGEAVERLVQLYDAWGKKDKAEEWRKKIPPELVPPPKEVPAK
jgi:tetratricopeptide (TPR) repeat protein